MGHQIIKQPDGQLAVWSSNVDDWIVYDATADELVELYVSEAADRARQTIRETVTAVEADEPERVYYQFVMTFDEAQAMRAEVHGAAPWPPVEPAVDEP